MLLVFSQLGFGLSSPKHPNSRPQFMLPSSFRICLLNPCSVEQFQKKGGGLLVLIYQWRRTWFSQWSRRPVVPDGSLFGGAFLYSQPCPFSNRHRSGAEASQKGTQGQNPPISFHPSKLEIPFVFHSCGWLFGNLQVWVWAIPMNGRPEANLEEVRSPKDGQSCH